MANDNLDAVRRHLRKRHRADRRFKVYCVGALCVSFAFLAFFLVSMVIKGLPAFRQAYIKTTITYNAETVDFAKMAVPEADRDLVSRDRTSIIPKEGLRSQVLVALRYPEGGSAPGAQALQPVVVQRQRAQIRIPLNYQENAARNPVRALSPLTIRREDDGPLVVPVAELKLLLDLPALEKQLAAELADAPELAGRSARNWVWASPAVDDHLGFGRELKLPHHLVLLFDGKDGNGEVEHRQVDEPLTVPTETLDDLVDADLLRERIAADLGADPGLAGTVRKEVWVWASPATDAFVEEGETDLLTPFQIRLLDSRTPNGELGLRRAFDVPTFGEETAREEWVLTNSETDQFLKHYYERYQELKVLVEENRSAAADAWNACRPILGAYLGSRPADGTDGDPERLLAALEGLADDDASARTAFLERHLDGLRTWLAAGDRSTRAAAFRRSWPVLRRQGRRIDEITRIEAKFDGTERIDRVIAAYESGQVAFKFNSGFFLNSDSIHPEAAGMRSAIVGSILVLILVLAVCFPVGVLTAIYLEEFAPDNWITQGIEVNINNLAAIPSILFGLLGLALFINFFGFTRSSALVGGLTLSLKVLPVVIISSRAALRAVPDGIRLGAQAMGATRWQAVCHHVLPQSISGILTGTIIGLAQAMGETAPLIIVGMIAFITEVPTDFSDKTTVMPAQIYTWYGEAQTGFAERAAAGILVMLAVLMTMNAIAIFIRAKTERRW